MGLESIMKCQSYVVHEVNRRKAAYHGSNGE
jgi:hypothetical protein